MGATVFVIFVIFVVPNTAAVERQRRQLLKEHLELR